MADPAESGEGAGDPPGLGIAEESRAHVGLNKAWREGVHGNAPRAELLREFEREDVERSLAHRVGSQPRKRHPRGPRRNVDDAAAVSQAWQGFLTDKERDLGVHREHSIEDVFGSVLDGAIRRDGRVVHEDVETSASVAARQFKVKGVEQFLDTRQSP